MSFDTITYGDSSMSMPFGDFYAVEDDVTRDATAILSRRLDLDWEPLKKDSPGLISNVDKTFDKSGQSSFASSKVTFTSSVPYLAKPESKLFTYPATTIYSDIESANRVGNDVVEFLKAEESELKIKPAKKKVSARVYVESCVVEMKIRMYQNGDEVAIEFRRMTGCPVLFQGLYDKVLEILEEQSNEEEVDDLMDVAMNSMNSVPSTEAVSTEDYLSVATACIRDLQSLIREERISGLVTLAQMVKTQNLPQEIMRLLTWESTVQSLVVCSTSLSDAEAFPALEILGAIQTFLLSSTAFLMVGNLLRGGFVEEQKNIYIAGQLSQVVCEALKRHRFDVESSRIASCELQTALHRAQCDVVRKNLREGMRCLEWQICDAPPVHFGSFELA